MIITVNSGDTIYSISQKTLVPVSKILADNGIKDKTLVVGQSLIIDVPDKAFTAMEDTSVDKISSEYGIEAKKLFRNNYILGGKENVPKGTFLVLSYENPPVTEKITGGYAYDFILPQRLSSVINYLTYIMPFTYGFTQDGKLIEPDDSFRLKSILASILSS